MNLLSRTFTIFYIFLTYNSYAQNPSKMLYYLVRNPIPQSQNPPILILLHGVGSNEEDLFSLSNQLPPKFLVISARAPFTISPGSYKWYDADFSQNPPRINPAQAESSRVELIQFIDQLGTKFSFDQKQVFLCGFSQGAIMSWSVALTSPDKVKGIIALSGRILEEIKPQMAPKESFKSLETLIIHGTEDHVLPVSNGRAAKKLMEETGIKCSYHELPLGHTINQETLRLMNDWLVSKVK